MHQIDAFQNNAFDVINPFVPNAPFLYPLKTSENPTVFWCFQGLEKGCIGNKWANLDQHSDIILLYIRVLIVNLIMSLSLL